MKLDIKKIYRSQGFNASSLAEAVGVSRTTISNWISGNAFPKPTLLKKLCEVLKCEIKDILVG